MKTILSTIFFCLLLVLPSYGTRDDYQYCGGLVNDQMAIFRDRGILVPPSTPTKVKTGLTVVGLNGIEDELQKLTVTILVSMQWDDWRIATKEPSCNKKPSKFVLEATKYLPWYPHFTIANSANTVLYEDGWRYFPSLVFANGTVRWIQEYQTETICILDLTIFPFDRQVCQIEFSSPHYSPEVLEYEVEDRSLAVQLVSNEAAQSPVWKIIGQTYTKLEGVPGIAFKLELERRPSFYLCALMLPTLVINIMTAASFITTPVFEEKPQTAQTCLFAYLLLNLVFYQFVPTSSISTPFLIGFFTIQNFLALGCFFAVSMIFRVEHAENLKGAKLAAERGPNAMLYDDAEEKSLFEDTQSLNDFIFIAYIAMAAASYLAAVIFFMFGSIQSDAIARAHGFTAPQVAHFNPPESS